MGFPYTLSLLVNRNRTTKKAEETFGYEMRPPQRPCAALPSRVMPEAVAPARWEPHRRGLALGAEGC